jgi:elongator complex protein 2
MSASVPPLGLSNKATSDSEHHQRFTAIIHHCHFLVLPASTSAVRRPFEAELASITLWPEVEKVFGHGYEGGRSIPTSLPAHTRY